MQTHRLFLCKTGFKAAQHGVLGVFCLIRTELARGRKKQKCPKMPQALSCDSPATTKPRIAYYRLLRAPAASGNGNAARQGEHNPFQRGNAGGPIPLCAQNKLFQHRVTSLCAEKSNFLHKHPCEATLCALNEVFLHTIRWLCAENAIFLHTSFSRILLFGQR